MNIDSNMFDLALQIAVQNISELKVKHPEYRFRMETCVSKDTVKVYAIKSEKIIKVITIDGNKLSVGDIE